MRARRERKDVAFLLAVARLQGNNAVLKQIPPRSRCLPPWPMWWPMSMTTLAMASVLVGCVRSGSEGSASQLVAKVNKSEITVLQLNAALSHVPNLNPQSAELSSKQVLQQLIDEELLVQKAREAKLDRNPGVVQAIEAAKRAVLANAWLQQSTADIPKPSDQDIQAFVEQHPEYFTARRLYEYHAVSAVAATQFLGAIKCRADRPASLGVNS